MPRVFFFLSLVMGFFVDGCLSKGKDFRHTTNSLDCIFVQLDPYLFVWKAEG